MLPSVISNLIWGSTEPQEASSPTKEIEIDHSASEEIGDWLLITCKHTGSSISGHSSRTYSISESDCESVTSDGSWVITPAPTFRGPKSGQPASDVFHPLEDLLIEHPTMSVYHQVKTGNSNVESEEESCSQGNENERALLLQHDQQRSMNCNQELVLLQNRQRHQLAMHMQIPLTVQQYPSYKDLPTGKPPRVSRKALQRHNANSLRSNKSRVYRVQKCCFKAGRRRC